MRLVDADALIASLGLQNCKKYGNADAKELADSYGLMQRYEIKDEIDGAPTIDAVEVVQCKDCTGKKACYIWWIYLDDDDFCSKGR